MAGGGEICGFIQFLLDVEKRLLCVILFILMTSLSYFIPFVLVYYCSTTFVVFAQKLYKCGSWRDPLLENFDTCCLWQSFPHCYDAQCCAFLQRRGAPAAASGRRGRQAQLKTRVTLSRTSPSPGAQRRNKLVEDFKNFWRVEELSVAQRDVSLEPSWNRTSRGSFATARRSSRNSALDGPGRRPGPSSAEVHRLPAALERPFLLQTSRFLHTTLRFKQTGDAAAGRAWLEKKMAEVSRFLQATSENTWLDYYSDYQTFREKQRQQLGRVWEVGLSKNDVPGSSAPTDDTVFRQKGRARPTAPHDAAPPSGAVHPPLDPVLASGLASSDTPQQVPAVAAARAYQLLLLSAAKYWQGYQTTFIGRDVIELGVVLPPLLSIVNDEDHAAAAADAAGHEEQRRRTTKHPTPRRTLHVVDAGCFVGDLSYSVLALWSNRREPSWAVAELEDPNIEGDFFGEDGGGVAREEEQEKLGSRPRSFSTGLGTKSSSSSSEIGLVQQDESTVPSSRLHVHCFEPSARNARGIELSLREGGTGLPEDRGGSASDDGAGGGGENPTRGPFKLEQEVARIQQELEARASAASPYGVPDKHVVHECGNGTRDRKLSLIWVPHFEQCRKQPALSKLPCRTIGWEILSVDSVSDAMSVLGTVSNVEWSNVLGTVSNNASALLHSFPRASSSRARFFSGRALLHWARSMMEDPLKKRPLKKRSPRKNTQSIRWTECFFVASRVIC